jgi:succinoglycan biosynthesis protein ExoO
MANHNGASYLADAIGSVQSQSLRDIEIIVSDDASSDDSVAIAERSMRDDPRIRLVKSGSRSGPGAARNRALALARGEWVAVMDSDDLIHPERLAILVETAVRDGADMVADDILAFHADRSRPRQRLLQGSWARGPFWVDIADYVHLNRLYGAGPTLGYLKPVFRASLFAEARMRYDETLSIAEDYDLVLRLLHSGASFRVYPLELYYYRKHDASTSHRLSAAALSAIEAADRRFLARISDPDPRLAHAVAARIRSAQTAHAYERLLTALKAEHWGQAAAIAIARPRAAALLNLPIRSRLRRLARLGAVAGAAVSQEPDR